MKTKQILFLDLKNWEGDRTGHEDVLKLFEAISEEKYEAYTSQYELGFEPNTTGRTPVYKNSRLMLPFNTITLLLVASRLPYPYITAYNLFRQLTRILPYYKI